VLQNVLVCLFCLPFLGFGLFAVNEGLNLLAAGDTKQAVPALIFGVVFTLVPLALLLALRRGRRALARASTRRARHPDEPWLWNEAWADGRIHCSNRSSLVVAWVFAVCWNAISWPLAYQVPGELERGNPAVWLALLFPLIGLGMLVWALRATLRWRRFGSSVFEMTTHPGVLGGELSGRLRAGDGLFEAREFGLRLSCIRRYVTGSGKSRSTHEDVLWTEDATLSPRALTRGPSGVELPLGFALPYDCRPSDPVESNDRILWRLEVRADVPGVDYAARFELPVFVTSESAPRRTRAALARERGGAQTLPAGPLPSGIVVRPHPQGGTEIVLPAGRHPRLALAVTLFAALFAGAGALCVEGGGPLVLSLVLAFFGALTTWGALRLWLRSVRVIVRSDAVELVARMPWGTRSKRILASEIGAVDLGIGMRAGHTSYWDLWLRPRGESGGGGRARSGTRIAASVADKGEAEQLLAVISAELGERPPPLHPSAPAVPRSE
jgi:hypothetical protein